MTTRDPSTSVQGVPTPVSAPALQARQQARCSWCRAADYGPPIEVSPDRVERTCPNCGYVVSAPIQRERNIGLQPPTAEEQQG